MPTPPPVHVPDPEDLAGLLRAAREHLFVGMSNADQLEAEGGPAIPIASKGIRFRDLAGHEYVDAFILPIAPPLMISAQEMDQLCDAVDGALGDVERALGVRGTA
ncbi:MAG TPA: hypothetical protein VML54_02440 [Candidatus Limnocylindrales bacterium]|nr:hypothetical protein [Candidatus Limnocylindrales bacterium]